MGENDPTAFFRQLQSLCQHVDKNVTSLKHSLNQPAGQKPHSYNNGLEALKKSVLDLKNESKVVHQQLMPTSNYSMYLESVQELITSKSRDIDKMEQYLAKFGYTPLPKPAEDTQMEIAKNEVDKAGGSTPGSTEECSDSNVETSVASATLSGTPVLSTYGQLVLQGKDLPVMQFLNQATSSLTSKPPESSLTRNTESIQTVNGVVRPGVETLRTPDIMPMSNPVKKKIMMLQQPEGHKSNQFAGNQLDHLDTPVRTNPSSRYLPGETQHIPSGCDAKCFAEVPTTPELSEHTVQFLKSIADNRDTKYENNAIDTSSDISTTLLYNNFSTANREPVVPKLTYTESKMCAPEEPTLYSQENNHPLVSSSEFEYQSHNEPVLSYEEQLNRRSYKDNRIPEEPALMTNVKNLHFINKSADTLQRNNGDVPCSPELSELTQSVLSLTSHAYQLNQNSSNTKRVTHKPHKVSQSFSSVYRQLSAPPSPDVDRFENSWGVQQPSHLLPRAISNTGTIKTNMATYSSASTMEQLFDINNMPPSPQLSDITQKIISQVRK